MSLLPTSTCQPATFSDLSIFGTETLSIEATLVQNYTATAPAWLRFTQPDIEKHNVSFCNVTVSYTHPGQDDLIYVETWLPADNWNGRLQAVGGGGWQAGRFIVSYINMNGAIADGYVTITTDSGLGASRTADPWALLSPGNVNLYDLQNLASVSLNDEALIGKFLARSFYGQEPEYSYWNGCSQGGRQGLMLAQRYPHAYDGISAAAPAINFPRLQPSLQWPQQIMNMLGSFPRPCELDEIRAAAIAACDGLDGVVDGIVAEPDSCLDSFNPFELVGTEISCAGAPSNRTEISRAAAAVANATWHGWMSIDGRQTGFGFSPVADLTGNDPSSGGSPGLAATNCSSGACVGHPNPQVLQWFQLFILSDPNADLSNLSHAQYDSLAHNGVQRYSSIIGTDDPDLSEFRDSGGKIITYHGLADNVIPTKSTESYYRAVEDTLPDVHDFYRYYEVPGMAHCYGGLAGQPTSLFAQLRAWVENGTVPESTPIEVTGEDGQVQNRVLCPYPKKPRFDEACGDVSAESCWLCQESAL